MRTHESKSEWEKFEAALKLVLTVSKKTLDELCDESDEELAALLRGGDTALSVVDWEDSEQVDSVARTRFLILNEIARRTTRRAT